MSEALENVARIVDGGDQTYPAGVGEHVLLLEGAEFQHLDVLCARLRPRRGPWPPSPPTLPRGP